MANLISYETKLEWEAELEDLKLIKRQENSQKIKEAREQGDLSENAEYDAAKDEQRDIEARITELEELLKNAEVYDADDEEESDKANSKDAIKLGSKIKILDIEFKEELEYSVKGSSEASLLKNIISNESPLGKALMGAKVGDTVEVEAPVGTIKYKVLAVENN